MINRKKNKNKLTLDINHTPRASLVRHFMVLVFLLYFISIPLTGELLLEIGDVHETSLKLIKGQWQILETGAIFDFTDRPARKLFGLEYYYYHTSRNFRNKIYLFTIVKSNKTGRLYFARGEYRNGHFHSSTSRIRFRGKNRFLVYSKDDYRQVLFEAVRIRKEKAVTGSQ